LSFNYLELQKYPSLNFYGILRHGANVAPKISPGQSCNLRLLFYFTRIAQLRKSNNLEIAKLGRSGRFLACWRAFVKI